MQVFCTPKRGVAAAVASKPGCFYWLLGFPAGRCACLSLRRSGANSATLLARQGNAAGSERPACTHHASCLIVPSGWWRDSAIGFPYSINLFVAKLWPRAGNKPISFGIICPPKEDCGLTTLLEPQYPFLRTKPVTFRVICPQIGAAAVRKGSTPVKPSPGTSGGEKIDDREGTTAAAATATAFFVTGATINRLVSRGTMVGRKEVTDRTATTREARPFLRAPVRCCLEMEGGSRCPWTVGLMPPN